MPALQLPKIYYPTWEPSPEECQACRSVELEYLPARWRYYKPAFIRTLVYRVLAGVPVPELKENRSMEAELLVLAELIPAVWGVTRSLEHQVVLHMYGVCLGCSSRLVFPCGDIHPLKPWCVGCIKEVSRRDAEAIPFWGRIQDWPEKYQREAIEYLVKRSEG